MKRLKKQKILGLLFTVILFQIQIGYSQNVAINDDGVAPNSSAILDVSSSNSIKGILIPRYSTADRTGTFDDAFSSTENGLTVFDTDYNTFFYWENTNWKEITIQGANWSVTGNTNINPALNFLGTTDAQPLIFKTNNIERARFDSNGNLGIGITLPDVLLHIDGGLDATYSDGTGYVVVGDINNYNLVFDANEVTARNNGATSELYLQNLGGALHVHYDVVIGSNDDTEFVIDENGDVGIGTNNPAVDLEITKSQSTPTVYIAGDGANKNARLRLAENDAGTYYGYDFYYNGTDNQLELWSREFAGNDARRMTWESNGYVGIGTDAPDNVLHIQNSLPYVRFTDLEGGHSWNAGVYGENQRFQITEFIDATTYRQRFVIKEGGNVGVGTVSPEGLFHIKADATNNATFIIDADAGTDLTDTWMIRSVASNNNLNFINDVSNFMSITSGGNVGIGTDSPEAKLHVLSSGTPLAQYAGTVATFQQNNATTDWSRISIIAGNTGASVLDFGDADKQDPGSIKYDHNENFMAFFTTNADEMVRITSGGNVGIMVSDPDEVLEVNGAIHIGNTANSNAGTIKWDGSNFLGYTGSVWKPLDVQTTTGGGWTDGGVNVYLTTLSDNVGIGTTTPAAKLDVNGDIYANTNIESGAVVQVGTEVNRTAQSSADLVPIAYGVVSFDGTIKNAGTGNWSVTLSSTGKYDINITGETYSSDTYMTQITPRYLSTYTTRDYTRIVTFGTDATDDELRVYMKDGNGAFVNTTFHFIVYKP